MTVRLACKSPGCTRTILPATAERTGGYCMPCVEAEARRKQKAYIEANRRDVNIFEGVEDPVELIKLTHAPRDTSPLIRYLPCPRSQEDLYAALDAGQITVLMEHASRIREESSHQAEQIARCLTAYTNADINFLLERFVAADRFYPGFAFLRANTDIRDALINRLLRVPNTEARSLIRNHLLSALAWIGDEHVVDLFAEWHRDPPQWKETLFVAPEEYAKEAGWELSTDLQRRDLYSRTCHALTRDGSRTPPAPAVAVSERSDHCAMCRGPLRNLIELEGGAELLDHLQWKGKLAIPFCEGRFETTGKLGECPAWHQRDTTQCEVEPSNVAYLPCGTWVMAAAPRSPWHAADPFLPTASFSQIGGHPAWVQDSNYPQCSECRRTMMFVGQVTLEDFDISMEGTHYAFVCPTCATTATRNQQT